MANTKTQAPPFIPAVWKKWERADLDLLTELFPVMRPKEIAERMGRSPSSIYLKAYALGLRWRDIPKVDNWKEEEVVFLIENYNYMRKVDVAKHLGRKHHDVFAKAQELGLVVRKFRGETISCASTLDRKSIAIAKKLGDGNLSRGLRIALQIAAEKLDIKVDENKT
jgi:hypothetical protein